MYLIALDLYCNSSNSPRPICSVQIKAWTEEVLFKVKVVVLSGESLKIMGALTTVQEVQV